SLPKCIINGNNDPYWTVDALNLYWNDLKGDKWVIYVPNAGHNLEQTLDNGRKSRSRAINSLAAFARHQIAGKPLPKLEWTHSDADGKMWINVECSEVPKAARLWVAQAQTRDFRQAKWVEQPAVVKETVVSGGVLPPSSGCLAVYAELD